MNDREIVFAALYWHAARKRRMSIGAEKRRLDIAVKESDADSALETMATRWRLRSMQSDAASRLTPAKRVELAALRQLAKACDDHRGRLDRVDDAELVDVNLLPYSD